MADTPSKKKNRVLETYIADDPIIDRILQRKTKTTYPAGEVDLKGVLREILLRANEFVPSDSGSILLDDPLLKGDKERKGKLYFMACFGVGSLGLVGTHLPDDVGIVGATYESGMPYLSQDISRDGKFYDAIDKRTKYESKSILAMPIKINDSVVGVIELINRKEELNYDERDLSILEKSNDYGEVLREAIEKNVFISEAPSPGESPLNIGGVITCSVGIASLEKDEGKELKTMKAALIRAADTAM